MIRARMLAPRALACSSVSITISAPASPNTKPLRSLSNGRQAPAGSSLLVDNTMRIWANAGDRHRLDPGLDATADRDVGLAERDLLPGAGDALRTGRARRHRGHHPGLGVPFQPDRRGRAVGHVHLHGQRRDRLHAACAHAVVGENQLLAGAHAGADRHHQPVGVHLGRTGVFPHPPAQHRGHLLQVAHPAVLDRGQLAVELLERDAHRCGPAGRTPRRTGRRAYGSHFARPAATSRWSPHQLRARSSWQCR